MQQILITLDPATNGLKVETTEGAAEAAMILQRALNTVVAACSRPASPIEAPRPEQVRKLVEG